MGFLNKMFSFLGFEDTEKRDGEKQQKLKPKKIKASYQLNSKNNKKVGQVQTKKLSSQQEIADFIDLLKKDGTAIVDLSNFEKDKKVRAFDFISGAVFALEGQMEKTKPNVYICSLDDLDFFLGEQT